MSHSEKSPSLTQIISPDTQRVERLPPRQVLTRKWPVLHVGSVPAVNLDQWDLRWWGLLAQPRQWSWAELRALPQVSVRADMHCVTRWSRLDMTWRGVATRELVKHVELLPAAQFVLIHCEQNFTTNLPLADFLDEDALFAWEADGEELTPDHGWPLRLVIPKLYAWKSAKWVRGVEFIEKDQPGYWERAGYHLRGDPWREERYGAWY
ncbi:MAG: sulfite oxidase-like oxidoreductase [Pirellulales bacterium]|nr:sulfite oxidase-like oxidoreductase [Pirellulales bacterium]